MEPSGGAPQSAQALAAKSLHTLANELPQRNDPHYDERVLDRVDWSHRGDYMEARHGVSPLIADDALGDPDRVVISPDYNSASGRSIRVIGFSLLVGQLITVILLEDAGTHYGVNGWPSNDRDRRIYREADNEEQA